MARRCDGLLTAEDFRRAARRRLPGLFFDYIDGAAGDEITARRNADAFAEIVLHPRTLRDVSDRTLSTRFLGGSFDLPLMLGPIGSLGMFRAGAETDAVRTAHRFGIPVCLSAFAMTAPEDMPEAPRPGDAWQLYVLKDRGRTGGMVDRIAAAGFDTLFVTVDTAVSGLRERDIRNGLRRIARHLFRVAEAPRDQPDHLPLALDIAARIGADAMREVEAEHQVETPEQLRREELVDRAIARLVATRQRHQVIGVAMQNEHRRSAGVIQIREALGPAGQVIG